MQTSNEEVIESQQAIRKKRKEKKEARTTIQWAPILAMASRPLGFTHHTLQRGDGER